MGLTLRLRLFVSGGLFMASWETFVGCDCVKGGKEYLRLNECGLKMMSDELEESQTMSKVVNKPRVSKKLALHLWAEVCMLL